MTPRSGWERERQRDNRLQWRRRIETWMLRVDRLINSPATNNLLGPLLNTPPFASRQG